jgi:ATP synthase protein I
MAEKPSLRQFQDAFTVGLHLVISTFVGLAMGYGLDSLFKKTKPWLTIIFLILGIVSGFRDLYRLAKKQSDESDKEDG